MKARMRQSLIGLALAATLAAMYLVREQDATVEPAGPKHATTRQVAGSDGASVAARSPATDARRATPVRLAAQGADLFPVRSWRPPEPEPVPAEAPAPVAPPLPYTFKGRMQEGGHDVVFLARQNAMLVVRQGDTLEGLYRVDAITPWSLEITYLPLKQKQSLGF